MVDSSTKITLNLVVPIIKSNQHVYNHLTGNGKNHRLFKKSIQAVYFPLQRDVIGQINRDWRKDGILRKVMQSVLLVQDEANGKVVKR